MARTRPIQVQARSENVVVTPTYVALCLVLSTLLAAVYLWPLPRFLNSKIIGDHPDRYFSLWAIDWVLHQGFGLLGPLFETNVLHPHQYSLLMSDSFIGEALFAAPLVALGANWALVYNVLLLMSLAVAGTAAAMFGAELTRVRSAGLVVLVGFAFFPARAAWINHVNLQFNFAMPLSLWALWIFLRHGRAWAIYVVGLSMALQVYLSAQLAIWTCLALLVAAPVFLWQGRAWRRWPLVLHALNAVVCAVVFVLPLLSGYQRAEQELGLLRSIRATVHYSGTWTAFWNDNGLLRFDPFVASFSADEVGYPGVAFCVLAGLGILSMVAQLFRRRCARLLVIVIVGCAFVVLGAVLFVGPVLKGHNLMMPYWGLREVFPGLSAIRVPVRVVSVLQLGLALLASLGAVAVLRLIAWQRLRVVVAVLLVTGLFVLLLPRPHTMQKLHQVSAVVNLLDQLPDKTLVLVGPWQHDWRDASYENYAAMFHRRAIVGGYSGVFSGLYRTLYREFDALPNARSLAIAQSLGVTYVVLEDKRLDVSAQRALVQALKSGLLSGPVLSRVGFSAYKLKTQQSRLLQPGDWQAYLPLHVDGPRRIVADSYVTTALRFPAQLNPSVQALANAFFDGSVSMQSQTDIEERKARYHVPPLIDAKHKRLSVSWQAPSTPGRYQLRFIVQGREMATVEVEVMDATLDAAAAAEVCHLRVVDRARVHVAIAIEMQLYNTGQRNLLARSAVEWPDALGELKLECVFRGQSTHMERTSAEFSDAALAYDLEPGASTIVHLRLKAPPTAGLYQLTCRPFEEHRLPLGPPSDEVDVWVR